MRATREQYLLFSKNLFFSHPNVVHIIFFGLINNFNIQNLKSLPNFIDMAKTVVSQLSSEKVLSNCLTALLKTERLTDTLAFLISTCRYTLTQSDKTMLLHNSCIYGSEPGIKFALAQGADINATDTYGQTALHLLVRYRRSTTFIKLLCNNPAINLDIQEQNGLPALYMAATMGNKPVVQELLKLKARTDLPTKLGHGNYHAWCQDISSRRYPIEALNIPPVLSSDPTQAHAFHALFFSPFNQGNVEKTKTALLKQAKVITQSDALFINLLLICHVTTTSFDTKNIERFVNTLITSYNIPASAIISEVFNTLIKFFRTQAVNPQDIVQLITFLVKLIDTPMISLDEKLEFYNHAAVEYNYFGFFEHGQQAAKNALMLFPSKTEYSDEEKKHRAAIFYNLGKSQFWQMNDLDALTNFKAAHESDSEDNDLYNTFMNQLRITGNSAEFLERAKQSNFGKFNELHQQIVQAEVEPSSSSQLTSSLDLLVASIPSLTPYEQSFAQDLLIIYYKKLGKVENATSTAKEKLNAAEQKHRKDPSLDIAIAIHQHTGFLLNLKLYTEAATFLKNYKLKYPIECNYPRLKHAEVIVQLAIHDLAAAEQLIIELEETTCQRSTVASLYISLATYHVQNKFDNAQAHRINKFLDKALVLDPDNEQAKYYKFLLALFLNEYSVAKQMADDLGSIESVIQFSIEQGLLNKVRATTTASAEAHATVEQSANISTQEEMNIDHSTSKTPLELELLAYEPVQLDRYFQEQKQQLFLAATNKVSGQQRASATASWVINTQLFQENADGLTKIDSIFYRNYYCVIQPGLFKDSTAAKRAQTAMAGGLCQRRRGTTGIITTPTCWYIKLDKDLCIVATEINENALGQCLIIFNQMRNHPSKNLLLAAYTKKMEIKLCTAQPLAQQNCITQTAPPPVRKFFPPVENVAAIRTMPQPLAAVPPTSTASTPAGVQNNSADGQSTEVLPSSSRGPGFG